MSYQIDWFQQFLALVLTGVIVSFVVSRIGGIDGLWDTIDISDNLRKTTRGVRQIDNGGPSIAFAIAFLLAAVGALIGAYHFDLTSSWDAMQTFRDAVAPSVEGLGAWSFQVLAVLTYLPTILEMFGAHFARLRIFWVQAVVIALCLFDLFTDLPKVTDFMVRQQSHFSAATNAGGDYLLNIAYRVAYNVAFGLWWFLASYGFELLFAVFSWIAIGCALKAVYGNGPARQSQGRRGGRRHQQHEDFADEAA